MSQVDNPETEEYNEDHHKHHHKHPHNFKGKHRYFKNNHHEHYSHSYDRPEEVKYEVNYDESVASCEANDEHFELPIENTIVKGTHSHSDASNSPEGKYEIIQTLRRQEIQEEIIEPKLTPEPVEQEEQVEQLDKEGFQTVENSAGKAKPKRKRK